MKHEHMTGVCDVKGLGAEVTDANNRYSGQMTLIAALVVFYTFWFFATPYYSPRLQFLAEMRFERYLAGALIILTLLLGRVSNLASGLSVALYGMLVFMGISSFLSEYADVELSLHWRDTFWKKMVYFAIVAAGLRSLNDIDKVMRWLVYICLFYQLYSWLDFLRGGSYVYQQGMKRMIGTWSGGGLGAANAFGMLSLFAIPFILFYYRTAIGKYGKGFAIFAAIVSIASIVFSGTRGTMVVALAYGLIVFRTRLLRPKSILLIGILSIAVVPMLPKDIKHRYFDLMFSFNSNEELSRTDEIAIKSGEGRIEGMINGFKLGLKRPVLGYGPGTSSSAVNEVVVEESEHHAQLHNLYGQVAAELGLVGLVFWALTVGTAVAIATRIKSAYSESDHRVSQMAVAIIGGFLVMLLYGMCSHLLYSERWQLLFGLIVALLAATGDTTSYDEATVNEKSRPL